MNNSERHELCRSMKRVVREKSLKQVDIALKTGISQSQISRILSGKFKSAERGRVMQICKFLGVEAAALSVPQSSKLPEAIIAAWDGSEAHEKALLALMSALKEALKA